MAFIVHTGSLLQWQAPSFPIVGAFSMATLSFTAFLNDEPIRFMVGSKCDLVRVVKETAKTITLSIRPGTLSSERLTIHKGAAATFLVCTASQVVKVTYVKKKTDGSYQLQFEATMRVKIRRPRFISIE